VFSSDFFGKLFGRGSSVGRLIAMSALGGVIVAAIAVPAVGALGIVVRNGANKFMSLSTNAIGEVPQRSEILDSTGHLLAYIYDVDESYYYSPTKVKTLTYDGIDRAPVGYSQISPNMRQAIVAIEDDRYWEHGAIDFRGTMRAIVNDLEHKPVQGGSTIAQQYVKNVLILTAKNPQAAESATSETLSRKIHELRLAIQVEHQMSRQDILAAYLNDAYFGYPIVGVGTAAQAYFGTSADKLSLADAADLAGMVENPAAYNPITNPATSLERRNTVIARMAQLRMISKATAKATENQPLGAHLHLPQNGCSSSTARWAAYFCDYVVQSVLRDSQLGKTPADRAHLLATGGLKIYTTLSPQDQVAANHAVNYEVPSHGAYNPGGNADTEAVVQPGTGKIRAIAQDRVYGTRRYQTSIDYAVDTPYGGGAGIQSGSSSKLFTLITALEQGVPFGYTETVQYHEVVTGYTNCDGQGLGPYTLNNADPGDHGTYSLYTGTTASINTYYAELEQKVGLCNVAKTAASLGVHRVNGVSIWKAIGKPSSPNYQPAADNLPSFTLGSMNVSPLTMAAAYASVASRGIYCAPVALQKIVTDTNTTLPVPKAGCHRVLSQSIADAVSYILQGVLQGGGTAAGDGIPRPAAGKTGTGNGPFYVDFAGYTPSLTSYTSVFDPTNTALHPMVGTQSCYRGGCPGEMYGANAPGQTWQLTFEHAALGPPTGFVPPDPSSPLFSLGNGQSVAKSGGGGKTRTGTGGGTPGDNNPTPGGGGHQGNGGGGHCLKVVPICFG